MTHHIASNTLTIVTYYWTNRLFVLLSLIEWWHTGISKWPYAAIGNALEVIPRTLAQNCGANVIRLMTDLRTKVNPTTISSLFNEVQEWCLSCRPRRLSNHVHLFITLAALFHSFPLSWTALTSHPTLSFYFLQSLDLFSFPCSSFTPTPTPLTLTCTTHSTLRLTMGAQHGGWMDAQGSQPTWPSSPYGSPTASKPKPLKPLLKGLKSLLSFVLCLCPCVSLLPIMILLNCYGHSVTCNRWQSCSLT